MSEKVIIPDWEKSDYLTTTVPFEWLYTYMNNKFLLTQYREQIKAKASEVGVKNFVALWNAYLSAVKSQKTSPSDNITEFEGQPEELLCGEYVCDDFGITVLDKFGFEIQVCNHPIMPVARLINIDSEEMKIEIAFKRGRIWRRMIVDRNTLASSQKIIELSKYGISVDSENAKHLVKYFTRLIDLNYSKMEEINSVGRLGWIADYGFSPYVSNLRFDGDISFKTMFDNIKECGSFEEWKNKASEVRKDSVIARIILAASFASVLVSPCNALPFFVHLWGGTGSGKTVALMLAASVWASPKMGDYIHTFNSTVVGQELTASFVNNMPLIMDELQVIKDRGDFDSIIYMLSEGVGRSRGAKTGGIQKLKTWKNAILSTGEMPISNSNSGGGAINRIIEIDCKDEKIFKNPVETVDIMQKNYGFAGKIFVDYLSEPDCLASVISIQKKYYEMLLKGESTEKQALAASLVLAADTITNLIIFKDGHTLSIEDIMPYLTAKDDVDVNKRALEFLYDFLVVNAPKFQVNSQTIEVGELWGIAEKDYTYIIKSEFDRIMRNEGYNPQAFLSWAKRCGLLVTNENRYTTSKRVRLSVCRCVCIKNFKENLTLEEMENIPF